MHRSLVSRELLLFHLFGAFMSGQTATFDTGQFKFTVSDDSVPYDSVEQSCEKMQLTQLSINSNADFDQVRLHVATDINLREAKVWVQTQITRNAETDTLNYLWPSGDAVEKSKFATHFGEPDGAGTGCSEPSKLCVGMSIFFKGINLGAYHLYDLCCSDSLRYMCNNVPEEEKININDFSVGTRTTLVTPALIAIQPYLTILEVKKDSILIQCHVSNIADNQVNGYYWYLNGDLYHNETDDSVWNSITIFGENTYSSGLFTCAVELSLESENVLTKQSESVRVTFYASTSIATDATMVECNQTVAFSCNTSEQNVSLIEGFAWKRFVPDVEFQNVIFTTRKNTMKIVNFQGHDIGFYSCAILYCDNITSHFSDEILVTVNLSQPNVIARSDISLDNTGGIVYTYEITCLHRSCAGIDGFIFERTTANVSISYTSVKDTFYIRYAQQKQSFDIFTVRCATVLKYITSDWSEEISLSGEILEIADSPEEGFLLQQSIQISSSSILTSSDEQLSTTAIPKAASSPVELLSSSPFLHTTLQSKSTSLSKQTTPEFMEETSFSLQTLTILKLSPTQEIMLSLQTAAQTSSLQLAEKTTIEESLAPPPSYPARLHSSSTNKTVSFLVKQQSSMDNASQTSPARVQQTLSLTVELSPMYSSTIPVTSHLSVYSFQASTETYQDTTKPNSFPLFATPVIMSTALLVEKKSNVSLICGTEKMVGWEITEYKWFFNNHIISNQSKFAIHIGSFDDMNVGEYKCVVMISGISSLESNTSMLALINSETSVPNYLADKPTFTSEPEMPEYGSHVTLSCLWNHSFASEYFIILNEAIVNRSVQNIYVIEMFRETDVGEYRCAVNLDGHISSLSESLYLNFPLTSALTTELTVNPNKPYLVPSFTVGYVGQLLIFSCFSAHTNIEEYVIFKVQTSLQIVYRGSSRDTLIKSVSFSDAGYYACLYKLEGGTNSEKSDNVSVVVIPSDAICYCPCPTHIMHLNLTGSDIKEMTSSIKGNLSLNVNNLSATVRQFVSAQDDRQSSAGIGTAAVGIVSAVFSLIIASDLIYISSAVLKLLKGKIE